MARGAALPAWETFLPLWSSGALRTVVVGDGEGLAVSVAVGVVEGGGLEACAAAGGLAAVAAGWAVEAVGWGLAGAGAAAGGVEAGGGLSGAAGVDGAGEGAGAGEAAGPLTVRTGAGSAESGGPIQRTTSPLVYV